MSKLSISQRNEIKELYKSGKTPVEISKIYFVNHKTIYYHLGLTNRNDERQRAREYKNLDGTPKIYTKRNGQYPDYHKLHKSGVPIRHHQSEARNNLAKNSLYAQYLKKELAKDKNNLPISVLFAHRMIQK